VTDRTGLSRGDRNRNARLARLRVLLPQRNAIVGIDLASVKQAAVVTDHDSRVLARRRVSARAWELGELLDWAVVRARAAGFDSVTVACEPTGHRWRVLDQLAAQRGLALVCVQPLGARDQFLFGSYPAVRILTLIEDELRVVRYNSDRLEYGISVPAVAPQNVRYNSDRREWTFMTLEQPGKVIWPGGTRVNRV
jgi:hypothetical protein